MAVSESLSSVSDTIFNLDIIHRTDMQGNISARQRAEEKLQLYASVFSYVREGIMITDIEGTILDIAMWRDLIQTDHWSNEIWNKRKSGEVYPQLLTISAAPDAQGIVRQYVALFSDITDTVARIGGDELVAMLRELDRQNSVCLAVFMKKKAAPLRHCERSAAIQEVRGHGLPRRFAPRSDEEESLFPLAFATN